MAAQADQIAERLLPQLTGGTARARYFSFLCWAITKSEAATVKIHRLEAELALPSVDESASSECTWGENIQCDDCVE